MIAPETQLFDHHNNTDGGFCKYKKCVSFWGGCRLRGARAVLVTLGADGALLLTAEGHLLSQERRGVQWTDIQMCTHSLMVNQGSVMAKPNQRQVLEVLGHGPTLHDTRHT